MVCICRAAYAVALLHDGLGIGLDDTSLIFTDTVAGPSGEPVPLDWTLGTSPPETAHCRAHSMVSTGSTLTLAIAGAVVVAAAGNKDIAALDKHFPLVSEVASSRGNAAQGEPGQPEGSVAEALLLVVGILLAAFCCLRAGRSALLDRRGVLVESGWFEIKLSMKGGQKLLRWCCSL